MVSFPCNESGGPPLEMVSFAIHIRGGLPLEMISFLIQGFPSQCGFNQCGPRFSAVFQLFFRFFFSIFSICFSKIPKIYTFFVASYLFFYQTVFMNLVYLVCINQKRSATSIPNVKFHSQSNNFSSNLNLSNILVTKRLRAL